MKKSMFLFTAVIVLVLQSLTTQGADIGVVSKNYESVFDNLDYWNKTLAVKLPAIMEKQVEKSFNYFNQGDYDSALRCLNTSLIFLNNFNKRYTRLYLGTKVLNPVLPLQKMLKLISSDLADL